MLESIKEYKSRYMTPENYPWVSDMVREIEREVSERFVELPVDADGVPIRDGDKVKIPNTAFDDPYDVFAVAHDYWVDMDGFTHKPMQTVHVKPRTVEDVLAEFGRESAGASLEETNALLAKYAAELRMRDGE